METLSKNMVDTIVEGSTEDTPVEGSPVKERYIHWAIPPGEVDTLTLPIQFVEAFFKNSKFFYFLQCARFASINAGHINLAQFKEFCESRGWNYETRRRALTWAQEKGWCKIEHDGTYFHVKSTYTIFNEWSGQNRHRKKAFVGHRKAYIPIYDLKGAKELRAFIASTWIKYEAADREKMLAKAERHESEVEKKGEFTKQFVDKNTGELKYAQFTDSDLNSEKNLLSNQCVVFSSELSLRGVQFRGLKAPLENGQFSMKSGNYYNQIQSNFKVKPGNLVADFVDVGSKIKPTSKNYATLSRSNRGLVSAPSEEGGGDKITRIYGAHVSLRRLAELTGLSQSTIQKYSNKDFFGHAKTVVPEFVLGEYDEKTVATLNNTDQLSVPYDLRYRAVRRKSLSMLKRKLKHKQDYLIFFLNNLKLDFSNNHKLTVIKPKCFRMFIEPMGPSRLGYKPKGNTKVHPNLKQIL